MILGIDGGLRRVGCARSDVERTLAAGSETVIGPRGQLLVTVRGPHAVFARRLEELAARHEITGFVLGWPLHEDGREGDLCPALRALAAWLDARFGVPVAFWEEFGSTTSAAERLRNAPSRVRRDRARRDRLAAEILLQEFLDAGAPFAERDWRRFLPLDGG